MRSRKTGLSMAVRSDGDQESIDLPFIFLVEVNIFIKFFIIGKYKLFRLNRILHRGFLRHQAVLRLHVIVGGIRQRTDALRVTEVLKVE